MNSRLDKVKGVIKKYFNDADLGLFFTRNSVGDPMTTIYCEDGIKIDICHYYEYFEVFGLNSEEQKELFDFYKKLSKELS